MDNLPLVLLHAFPLDSRMWDPIRPELAPITPDLRGRGRTPDLAAFADDVLELIEPLGRVILGGCSMGGYATMAVLRRAPEKIAGIVFADTRATADTPQARANRLVMADRVEAEGVGWVPDAVLPGLLGPDPTATAVAALREIVLDQDPAEVAWAQRAMARRPDSTEVLRGLDVPALVLVGAHDAVTPPDQARALAGLLPRADYVELPDVGHLTPVEAPEAFAAAVRGWAQRLPD
ncbi:alpha/beta hydrolase [Actinosynnema sp. NPDC020468]|uniref:alpha/beta fold hydrolase n=1 Tax=Actinosynnema sp. NPDC020468 TaxID=3154488 RepID=UPI0033E6CBE1